MADAIIAKAKAIYGHLLTHEDYNNLLHKTELSDVVAYLKTTLNYKDTFANVNEAQIHRGQVEQLISKDVFELYLKLCRFMAADKNSFCYYLIKELEIKQIITALMYINAGSQEGYLLGMPSYLMGYVSFDLMKLAQAKSYAEVLNVLSGTPYAKVLKPMLTGTESIIELDECAVAMFAWYVHWAFKTIDRSFKGAEAKSLKEIFLRQSDLNNIMMCYRKKSLFNEDKEKIKRSLYSTYYRLTPQLLDEILSQPDAAQQLLNLLKKIYLKNRVEYDPENIEIAIRRYNFSYYKKQLCFSKNGTMALYALMALCEVESSNLRKIIESVRYGRPPAETEKLLVI